MGHEIIPALSCQHNSRAVDWHLVASCADYLQKQTLKAFQMKQSMQVASFNLTAWHICFRNWVPKSFPFKLLKCQGRKWLMVGTKDLVQSFQKDSSPIAGRDPHHYWSQLPSRPVVGLCRKLSTAEFPQATLLGSLRCHHLSWILLSDLDTVLHPALWVESRGWGHQGWPDFQDLVSRYLVLSFQRFPIIPHCL